MLFQFNAKDSSVKLQYDPQPRPRAIAAFSEKTVVKVACGTNHTGFFLFYCVLFWAFLINTDANTVSLLFWCSCSWFKWLCLYVCVLFVICLQSRNWNNYFSWVLLYIPYEVHMYAGHLISSVSIFHLPFLTLAFLFCRWGFGGYGRYTTNIYLSHCDMV
jgi:hypothetical protein